MPYDRYDGYYGIAHSLTSYPPKRAVTQRVSGSSDKTVIVCSNRTRPTESKGSRPRTAANPYPPDIPNPRLKLPSEYPEVSPGRGLTKPQDYTENNGVYSWLGLDTRGWLGYAAGVVTGILLAAIINRL